MKATLYIMTQKGFEVLKALTEHNYEFLISEVIIGRDKNIDNDFADEITSLCQEKSIKHYERKEAPELSSDYSITISWRWLIRNNKSQLIVLHDSLLPKYRGFAPLVNMLINKEKEIGVSAIFASAEYDKGDIIAQSSSRITYPITIAEAIDIISQNYIRLVLEIFERLKNNEKIIATPQNHQDASYSLWRNQDDYLINWQQSADDILTFINAVSSPYEGASTFLNGRKKIRILVAELEEDVVIVNRDVGKVIFVKDSCPVIVCGKGLLKLLKAIDDETGEDILPFKSFRIKLASEQITPHS